MNEKIDIDKLCDLARIKLPENEKDSFREDVEKILSFVGKVQEIDPDLDAEGRLGVSYNVMRNDDSPHEPGIFKDQLLKQAPFEKNGYVQVKKVL